MHPPPWPAQWMQPGRKGNYGDEQGAEKGDFVLQQHYHDHSGPAHAVTMSTDSKLFVSASWDASMQIYDVSNGVPDGPTRTINGNGQKKMDGLYSLAFAKTAPEFIGCTSVDKYVYLWNHETCEMEKKLGGEAKHHQDEVNDIDFHAEQEVMVTVSDDLQALIWDFREGSCLRALKEPHGKTVYGATFLGKDLQYNVATCCFDRRTRIWDMRDKQVTRTLENHTDDIIGIDFTDASEPLLATGSDDGRACIWSCKTWKVLHTLDTKVVLGNHENEVKRIAFSRDGSMLACACSIGKVQIFTGLNTGNPSPLPTLSGHSDCVFDVSWGQDPLTGRNTLVSSSHDHSVIFWKQA